jgi:hypothetical protein
MQPLRATLCLLLLAVACAAAPARVVYLPFEDRVKLKEAWNLALDVPRWFSQTVDTIVPGEAKLAAVPFDSVQALIALNAWKRGDYTAPLAMQRIAARFDARLVVTGTVERFKIIKRALTGDGALGGGHGSVSGGSLTTGTVGSEQSGGLPLSASLQSYTARVRMTVSIYDGGSGALLRTESMDLNEKDGGLKIWLPLSIENDEMNFYYMGRSPFGSPYFHKNVAGAMMKECSRRLAQGLAAALPQAPAAPVAREYLEGKVLDRVGSDVYLNLGSADNLMLGEELEVLKPQRPVLGDKGDTLGWVEAPVATLRVRSVKSSHFSQAGIERADDSVQVGWTVRPKSPAAPAAGP